MSARVPDRVQDSVVAWLGIGLARGRSSLTAVSSPCADGQQTQLGSRFGNLAPENGVLSTFQKYLESPVRIGSNVRSAANPGIIPLNCGAAHIGTSALRRPDYYAFGGRTSGGEAVLHSTYEGARGSRNWNRNRIASGVGRWISYCRPQGGPRIGTPYRRIPVWIYPYGA